MVAGLAQKIEPEIESKMNYDSYPDYDDLDLSPGPRIGWVIGISLGILVVVVLIIAVACQLK